MTALARRLSDGRDPARHVLMTGWHKACLGDPLLAFLRGETTLHLSMQHHEVRLATDTTKPSAWPSRTPFKSWSA